MSQEFYDCISEWAGRCAEQSKRIATLEAAVKKYATAMDEIYNHNDAARAAVIQHFGLRHPQALVQPGEMSEDMSERLKAELCKEWLQYCKSLGWKSSAMPALADLFWQQEGWKTFKGWKP